MKYQEMRDAYWAWLTGFKNNHGYLNRSHTFSNFLLFLEINKIELEEDSVKVWNWYFC